MHVDVDTCGPCGRGRGQSRSSLVVCNLKIMIGDDHQDEEAAYLMASATPLLDGERDIVEEDEKSHKLFSLASISVIAIGTCGSIEYAMLMPVLNEYVSILGQSKLFYGFSMSCFSAARLLTMPILGYWSDKRPMLEPLIFSVVVSILGNILYALAWGLDTAWLILVGRIFVGIGAANVTVSMSYISRVTSAESRTKSIAMLNGLNMLGVVAGPALNLLIVDFKTEINKRIVFNKYTNPGWFMVLILAALLFLMLTTFVEPPKQTVEEVNLLSSTRPAVPGSASSLSTIGSRFDDINEPMLNTGEMGSNNLHLTQVFGNIIRHRLWIYFLISFTSNFVLCELEVSLPALTATAYDWNTVDNSIMYAFIGVFVALNLAVLVVLSGKVSDRTFLGIGLVGDVIALTVACIVLRHTRPSFAMFVVVSLMLIASVPLTGSPNIGLYTKTCEKHQHLKENLGFYIGVLQSVNGLSRIIGPIYAGIALPASDYHPHDPSSDDANLMIYVGPLVIVCITTIVFLTNFSLLKFQPLA